MEGWERLVGVPERILRASVRSAMTNRAMCASVDTVSERSRSELVRNQKELEDSCGASIHSDSIKNCLALFSEPSKYENSFGSNRFDYLSNIWIV